MKTAEDLAFRIMHPDGKECCKITCLEVQKQFVQALNTFREEGIGEVVSSMKKQLASIGAIIAHDAGEKARAEAMKECEERVKAAKESRCEKSWEGGRAEGFKAGVEEAAKVAERADLYAPSGIEPRIANAIRALLETPHD